jgi:aspartate aminotransferase
MPVPAAVMPECINPNLLDLDESATLAINDRSKQLMAEGKTIYKFGLGQSPFPVPNRVVEALRLHAPQKDYLPVKGHPRLRQAVAGFINRKDGLSVSHEGVIIGPGSKELVFLLQLVFNGELIVVSPCWVSYMPQAKILGKKITMIQTTFEDHWHLTPERFEKFLKERENVNGQPSLMILNYPGNPDGVDFNEEQLFQIAELARQHHIVILSDEIYGQLHHQGRHQSIARFYPEGTIISSGLSKWCGAGGWRLGAFSFPLSMKWLLDKMAVVASETYTSVSAPIQFAAIQAFKGSMDIEEYLWHERKILSKLGTTCVEILRNAKVMVHDPVGGFYLFLDFTHYIDRLHDRGIHNSREFCETLLEETGVALLDGAAFGRPLEEFTARMAYVDFDGSTALAASQVHPLHEDLPDDFLQVYCPKVIDGTRILAEWLKKL